MSKSKDEVLKEIFKRLEQEIRLHQVLARKSQREILRKSKLQRSNFDDNVYFSDTIMLSTCSLLEVELQKLKDEFLKEVADE